MSSNAWRTLLAALVFGMALAGATLFDAVQPMLISNGLTNGFVGPFVIPVYNFGVVLFLIMAAVAAIAIPLSFGWNVRKDGERTPIYFDC